MVFDLVMAHEDYKAMIPARSLAALDAEEDRAFSSHLAECAECRHELDQWNGVAASLALSVPAREPSPAVREKLLKRIATEEPEPAVSNVIPLVPKRNVWSSFGSVGAIAAGLLLIALGGLVFMLWRQNVSLQAQLADQTRRVNEIDERLAQERKLVEQFTAPGTQMFELRPTSAAPGAKAMVAVNKDGHATLLARGLPIAPPGKAYQVWYIVGDKPLPGRVFRIEATGQGRLEDQLPQAALKSAVFAITMEAEQGATTPTAPILLSSSL